ncbi:Outer membrane protein TolC [Catalinimonas alkaloidigena]|uniref:Outer membrane protein TolC n=1 Tax=Catalinimonas alkaloidigena TaxID=1075417 RepID=A0A1G9PII2_9BACT|nr:TolC family protein [Catalinimonas alkaloidigena]SDL98353.1 Outer membrane protein TolC [Catalinimonas alkaloidigena]
MGNHSFTVWALALSLLSFSGFAQPSEPQAFTLEEAVAYAMANSEVVKNSQLDAHNAAAQVGEIRAAGLPQISGTAELTDNFLIPVVILPAEAGGMFGGGGTPTDPDQPVVLRFGIRYQGSALLSASQMLFDGSYLVGLKAANTYKELSQKQLRQTRRDIIVNVSKAYYGALVNRERLTLLDLNISRLDSTLFQTKGLYENGFAEEIDVMRLEVQRNNLATERSNAERLVAVSEALLKFQMGYDLQMPITLKDQLAEAKVSLVPMEETFDYSQRIEYSVLETQRDLAFLDIRNTQSGYLPKLSLFARYGFTGGDDDLAALFNRQWYSQGAYGLRLTLPIFDGLQKKYRIQQNRVAYDKTQNGFALLKRQIDLERQQASAQLNNALETLENEQRNLQLAEEVARVTQLKFEEGFGSNLEVVNAEADLKAAQTNYYNALYDALVAKVDLDKANGTLLNESLSTE